MGGKMTLWLGHFLQDHAMVTKILDFIHKSLFFFTFLTGFSEIVIFWDRKSQNGFFFLNFSTFSNLNDDFYEARYITFL